MKEIVKVLLQEGIDEETIHEVLNIIEENYEIISELKAPNAKNAQAVVDRKISQLKQNSDNMKQAENKYKTFKAMDVAQGYPVGMENKVTREASLDHKKSIHQGAGLNTGAIRVAKAGKKYGANIDNLKHSVVGHNNDVRRQIDSRNNIKRMG